MEPSRMARKVPISTRALPDTSSLSSSCWGMMEYLIGPKKVDCRPMQNSTPSRKYTASKKKPTAAADMMQTSTNLILRTSEALSYLSATWPARAENRKNGRMNRARATLFRVLTLIAVTAPEAISSISAWRKTLSLKAPRNWVKKKGPNRRDASRESNPFFTVRSLLVFPLASRPGSIQVERVTRYEFREANPTLLFAPRNSYLVTTQ